MKTIKQILQEYNYSICADSKEEQHLVELSKLGILEESKLPLIQRALSIDPELMTIAEKNNLLELLDSLISHILYEESSFGITDKPRGPGNFPDKGTNFPNTRTQAPMVIIFKRKAIRIFPGNQLIGLYYSDMLDKYISIPFNDIATMSLGTHLNESSLARAVAKAKYQKDNAERDKSAQETLTPAEYEQLKKNRARQNAAAHRYELHAGTHGSEKYRLKGSAAFERSQVNTGSVAGDLGQKLGITLRHGVRKAFNKITDKIRSRNAHKAAETDTQTHAAPAQEPAQTQTDKKPKITAFKVRKPSSEPNRPVEKPNPAAVAKSQQSYSKIAKVYAKSTDRVVPASATVPAHKSRDYYRGLLAHHKQEIEKGGGEVPQINRPKRVIGPRKDVRGKPPKGVVKPPSLAEGNIDEGFLSNIYKTGKYLYRNWKRNNRGKEPIKTGQQSSNGSDSSSDVPNSSAPLDRGQPNRTGMENTLARRRSLDKLDVRNTRKTFNVQEMYRIIEEGTPRVVNIGDEQVTINSTIAKKVLMVYESLNRKNQKQMEKMLNESVDSFKKVINFSIRLRQ